MKAGNGSNVSKHFNVMKCLVVLCSFISCLIMGDVREVNAEPIKEVLSTDRSADGWIYEYQVMDDGNAAFVRAEYDKENEDYESSTVTIPEIVDGYKVTRVGYVDYESEISIMVYNADDSINANIQKVIIPDSVTVIGAYAFQYLGYTSIELPSTIESIEKDAFYGCSGLSNISLPEGLKTIGANAFAVCQGIETITLPASIESVGDYAFYNCTGLKTFECLKSTDSSKIVTWGKAIFSSCTELTEITIPDGVQELQSLGYDFDKVTTINLPDSLKIIKENTFEYMKFEELTIPSNVELIERNAFNSLYFKKINFTNPVFTVDVDKEKFEDENDSSREPGEAFWQGDTRIKDGNIMFGDAFVKCNVDNGVMTIPNYEFEGYYNNNVSKSEYKVTKILLGEADYSDVKTVSISSNIEEITGKSFINMPHLTTFIVDSENTYFKAVDGALVYKNIDLVKWPNSCDEYVDLDKLNIWGVREYAFANCSNLKTVVMPLNSSSGYGSVNTVYVDDHAFQNCSNLTTVQGNMSVNTYYSDEEFIFDGVPLNKLVLIVPQSSGIVLYASLHSISYKPYMVCKEVGLTEHTYELTSYNGIEKNVVIPDYYSDTSSSTPGKIVSIGTNAFNGNKTAETISIPDTVSDIDAKAFSGCTSLQEFNINNSMYGSSYYGEYTGTNYSIYQGLLCSKDGTTVIVYPAGRAGEQDLCDSRYTYSYNPDATRYCKITSIGANAISGCTNTDYLYISKFITEIDDNAFGDNGDMTLIVDEGSTIEAFAQSKNLKYILAGEADTIIPHCEFSSLNDEGTLALIGIRIPSNVGAVSIHVPSYVGGRMVTQIGLSDTSAWGAALFNTVYYGGDSNGCSVTMELPSTISRISEDIDMRNPNGELTIKVSSENPYYKVDNNNLLDMSGKNLIYTSSTAGTYSISEGVNHIYQYAISNDTANTVSELKIPSTLEDLSGVELSSFYRLSKISVDERNKSYYSDGKALFSKDMKTLIFYAQYNNQYSSQISYTVPDSVEVIGPRAFSGRGYGYGYGLTSLIIPEGVREIGEAAMANSGINSVTIEAKIEELPNSMFSGCSNLKTVSLPATLKKIGINAFRTCTSLTSITIPDGVTEIGDAAFFWCTSLKTINLGENIEKIGNSAFYLCNSLTGIELGDKLKELGSDCFYSCSSLKSVKIPDTVNEIKERAFESCSGLSSVEIGKNVGSIGKYAFDSCRALVSVTIPASVKIINNNAFSYCYSLVTVNCEEGLTDIKDYVFSNCTKLNTVILPESLTSIGANNFISNKNIILYVIEDSYAHTYAVEKSITFMIIDNSTGANDDLYTYKENSDGTVTLTGYTGEDKVIDIPGIIGGKVVTVIGRKAFYGNTDITEVNIPITIQTLEDEVMMDCTGLTTVTGGDRITGIGMKAFMGCTNLSSITLGDKVTSIDTSTFKGCEMLESVKLPKALSKVPSSLFEDCKNLKEVTFGGSETSIGSNAFAGCEKLTSVNIPKTVTSLGTDALSGCSSLETITINYTSATSNYLTRSVASGCTSLKAINTSEDCVNLEGRDGVLYNKKNDILVWYPESLEGDYEISDGTKTISSKAFLDCKKIGTVTVPATVTDIASDAFLGCGENFVLNLLEGNSKYVVSDEGILYNSEMTEIKGLAHSVSGKIIIPDTVVSIEDSAFEGQTGITYVYIPGSVTTIPKNAFAECTGLKEVVIGDGVETISNNAFAGCTGLIDVTIPDSVESIAKTSFDNCSDDMELHVNYDSVAWEYARSRNIKYSLPVVAITGLTLELHTYSLSVGSTSVLFVDEKLPADATEKEHWISSDESVVTVNKSGVITAKSIGKATITVCNEDETVTDSCVVDVVEGSGTESSEISISEISFEEKSVDMTVGDATIIEPFIVPSNANEKPVWSSSDENVVSVNSNGIIRALKAGEATISASAKAEGVSASILVNVKAGASQTVNITGISFNNKTEILRVGNTSIIDAVVEPADANETLKWKSSDTNVCEIDENTGIVRAKSEGKAIITAYCSNKDVFAECEVEVKIFDTSIKDIVISRSEIDLLPGDSELLTTTVTPENTDENVKWTSANTNIVKVSPIGYVTAVSVGETEITVSNQSGSVSKTCKVKVWEKMIPLTDSTVDVEGITDFFYDTTTKKQSNIVVKYGGKALSEGKEYNIAYSNDCINAGTVTITISGMGLYSGTITKTYNIIPHRVLWADGEDDLVRKVGDKKLTFAGAKPYTIPGSMQSVMLQPGTDYNTDVKTLDCNTPGIYEVTYTFSGNYTGTHVRRVIVYPKKNIKSAKYSKKAVTVKWTKWSNVTGYYVMRSTKKNSGYKVIKNIKKAKTVTYKDKKVKKGKTYYYKVVPYKNVSGTIYQAEGVEAKKLKVK